MVVLRGVAVSYARGIHVRMSAAAVVDKRFQAQPSLLRPEVGPPEKQPYVQGGRMCAWLTTHGVTSGPP